MLMIVGIWAWGLYDLKVRASRVRKLHGDSQWAIASRHFKRNKLAIAGLILMIGLYLMALLARARPLPGLWIPLRCASSARRSR